MRELCGAFAEEHAVQIRQVELIDRLCAAFSALDSSGPVMPGQERLLPAGADGTPLVAEHLATELAPKLRMPIEGAFVLIADSMNLVHRHPRLWDATREGRVRVWQARTLARATATAGLSREAAAWVDEQLEPALGRLAWGRVKRKLSGLILRADVELAARKAAQAKAERFVRVRNLGDGTALVTARADAADALRFSRTLDQLAGQLSVSGETDERDVLRATALGVLAEPEQAVALLAGPDSRPGTDRPRQRRTAELVIHYAPGERVGRSEELGPVLAEQVRDWLGHDRVVVRPVVDLADNPSVDAYEIPEAMARVVRLRNPYDVFPWSGRTSRGLDLDHTRAYQHGAGRPPAQTNPDNLGPLSRRAHRAKTHSGWQVSQPFPGVFAWRSPLGFRYQVDADGSRELRPDEPVRPPGVDGRGPRPERVARIDVRWLLAA